MPLTTIATLALAFSAPAPAPDTSLSYVSISTGGMRAQHLPLTLCSNWPVWVCASDGSVVARVPDGEAEDEEGAWVDPRSFEQLWLPEDLPLPRCCAAIGAVLKDGAPRYLFPTLEATVGTSIEGATVVWHNRGLNSLPLGRTWLSFDEVPIDSLRFSCYRGEAAEASSADADDTDADADADAEWDAVLPLTSVRSAIEALFRVSADAPPELADGFQVLIAPLGVDGLLPAQAVRPGSRLRAFLSDVEHTPACLDADDEAWAFQRAECDVSLYAVPAGGQSEYMPKAYGPLYGKAAS